VERGESIALHCGRWAGSSVLLDILYGLRYPEYGHVDIEGTDTRDLRLDALRDTVALVRTVEVFEGTIAENVQMARPGVSMTDVRAALHTVGLLDAVLHLPAGLDTTLNASGSPLLATQLQLLMLARAIAARPRLLMIDGALDVLGDAQLDYICDQLQRSTYGWTVLVATNRRNLAKHFESVVNLEYQTDGRVATPFLTSALAAEVAT
jgi:ABC-type bacteriocin/lantibiotic exporter with double-glycine peptidase domain